MPRALDATYVLAQLDLLQRTQPDIWDDKELREIAVASETNTPELLTTVVRRMLMDEAMVIGTEVEIADMKARHDRYKRRIEALRALAMKVMQHADVRKVELPIRTLSIHAGPRKVIITDEALLPEGCVRIKREPDKIAIKKFIDEGSTIPGAELSNAEQVLQVRK